MAKTLIKAAIPTASAQRVDSIASAEVDKLERSVEPDVTEGQPVASSPGYRAVTVVPRHAWPVVIRGQGVVARQGTPITVSLTPWVAVQLSDRILIEG